jgi:uroporphyrinogen decarboxylase
MTETASEKGFQGLRVVSFESRRSDQMADLIQRNGGEAIVAPSMREIPLEENKEAFSFAEKLLKGEVDFVIFLTGVGTRTLFEVLQTRYPLERIKEALSKTTLVVRGPKPITALSEFGLIPQIRGEEPNTWKELLGALDHYGTLKGKTVAVQEHGAVVKPFIHGLVQRGARVVRVPVYRWALPEDTAPLRKALKTVIEGEADVLLFTNANQISHVLQLAQEDGIEKEFREAVSHMVVASVGPVCTQFLDEYGVPVDIEPEHPKMGNLVLEASRRGPGLLQKKRHGDAETRGKTIEAISPRPRVPASPLHDALFMKACRMEPTSYTPIWLMRQAGRYMKEYRTLRERHGFLDLCKDSDLACEVTVYAVQRLGVDAAIIFSDILLILEPMGLQLEYAKGDGPVIHNPVRSSKDVNALRTVSDPAPLGFVFDAIKKTRQALPADIPLIGFSGAPFTLASYLIEGHGSRNYIHTKALMHNEPAAWHALMKKLSESLVHYLNAQIAAGAQAVQLFDSWVGCLSPNDYREFVLPHTQSIIRRITSGTPVLHFGTGTGALLELMKEAGGDVIGLDWRVELDAAWKRLGKVAIQGNMDPVALFGDLASIRKEAKRILGQAAGRPGHIFNLGHGILPETPVGHVKALVDAVHEFSVRA